MNINTISIKTLLLLCIGTLLYTSCDTYEAEEIDSSLSLPLTRSITEADIPVDFFDYSIAGIDSVIRTVRWVNSENPFIEDFKQEYGMPLWDYTYIMKGEGEVSYFVPVYNSDAVKDIQTIWFFHIANGRMKYAPIERDDPEMEDHEQRFMFDLLSYNVFGEENASGKAFTPRVVQPRGWFTYTECWTSATMPSLNVIEIEVVCAERSVWMGLDSFKRGPGRNGGGSTGEENGGIPPKKGDSRGGGGNGSSGDVPLAEKEKKPYSDVTASVIYKNDSLPEEIWRLLDTMILEIADDCAGGNLLNAIKSKLNGDKIKIQVTDEKGSSYNMKTNTLTLSNNMLESHVYFHEMFHLYQILTVGVDNFQRTKMNREIEAAFAQYQFAKGLDSWEEQYDNIYWMSKRWKVMAFINAHLDEHGNMRNGNTLILLREHLSHVVVPVFRSEGYTNYTFDESLPSFTNIKTITKNCK